MEEIVTGEAVVLDLPCARFPTRVLARLIDLAVQALALIAIAIAAAAGAGSWGMNGATGAAVIVTTLVVVLVGYPVAFETLSRGRTLGKLALGLRVVADDGGPVRFRQALVRGLAGTVECWAMAGVPALITSMLSARGKRLGDIFAGTFVLRERAPGTVPSGLGGGRYPAQTPVEPALRPWAASLDLSGLPEPLAASAAGYLSRYWQLDDQARDRLGWQLACDISARVSPPPPPGLPPVAYLIAVLAERRNRELARLWATGQATPPVVPAVPAWPPAAPAPGWRPAPPAWQATAGQPPAAPEPPPAGGFTPPA